MHDEPRHRREHDDGERRMIGCRWRVAPGNAPHDEAVTLGEPVCLSVVERLVADRAFGVDPSVRRDLARALLGTRDVTDAHDQRE